MVRKGDSVVQTDLDPFGERVMLDTIPEAIIGFDARGVITLFNRAAEAVFGYSAAEVLGRSLSSLICFAGFGDRDRSRPNGDSIIRKDKVPEVERVNAVHKSGKIFPAEFSASEARLGSGTIHMAVVRDISYRLWAEEASRNERDFVGRLVETSQVLIKVLDANGRIIRFNPYLEKFCGCGEDEVRGRDWVSIFVSESEQSKMRAIFELTLKGIETREFVNTIVAKDGSRHVVEWCASTLRNSQGEVIGVFSIGVDATERIRAERELQELQKLAHQQERLADLGAIAAEIVHDVGNPLAALSMQAQLVRKRTREHPDHPLSTVRQPVEKLVSELHRLESLVREFMNFAREQRLEVQTVEVSRFLSEVSALWASVAAARDIELTFVPMSEPFFLKADKDKLVRVFDNLIKNAIEAIDRGPGRVVLRVVGCNPGKIRISVEDNGPGVAAGVQLFRLFETTKVHGTGLGLPIARQIILAHGGSIDVEPLIPCGTVFHIDFPLDDLPRPLN